MSDSEQSLLVYKLKGFENPIEMFTNSQGQNEILPLKLLVLMAVNKAHGVLTFKDDSEKAWQIGMEDGVCYGALRVGQHQEEALGKKLVEHIGIDIDTVTDILKKTKQQGKGSMGFMMLLLGMGNITAQQILQVFKLTRKDILNEVVGIKSGEAELDTSSRLNISKDPIKIDILQYVNDYIYTILKKLYYRDLGSIFDEFMGMYPTVSKSMSNVLMNNLLTDDEKKTLEVMDGSITLKDYFAMTKLSKHAAARMLVRLLFLNFMQFAKKTGSDASIKKKEEELTDLVAKFSRSDYFDRLGVHWTAHKSEIEKAFQKRVKNWGPDADLRKVSEKVSELCVKLFKYTQDAYQVLSDTEKRKEYRKQNVEKRKLIDGADFLYQQAQISLFRGDINAAKRLIESSLDIDERPIYRKFYKKIGGSNK